MGKIKEVIRIKWMHSHLRKCVDWARKQSLFSFETFRFLLLYFSCGFFPRNCLLLKSSDVPDQREPKFRISSLAISYFSRAFIVFSSALHFRKFKFYPADFFLAHWTHKYRPFAAKSTPWMYRFSQEEWDESRGSLFRHFLPTEASGKQSKEDEERAKTQRQFINSYFNRFIKQVVLISN